MSRILRRPMFRGGRVESRGTGITSGLGYASGGQVTPKRGLVDGPGGYAGEKMEDILSRNFGRTEAGGKFKVFGQEIPGTGVLLDDEGIPYDPKYVQEILKKNRGELNSVLSILPLGRTIRGANMLRSGLGTARSGLPSASKVKDFFTKYPESSSKVIGPPPGPAPIGTNRYFSEKLGPGLQNTKEYLKDSLGGVGKLKDYGLSIGVGGIGGTYALAKGYEAWKDSQKETEKVGTKTETASPESKLTNNGTITAPVKTDKQVIQEYMDMFKENLGGDTEDLKRSRYLELAKFGANLLGQPGGQSLGEAVGRAAAPTLEGFSKIEATERAGDRQAKALGFQAALRELEPGPIRKAIKDLKKVGFSDEKAKEIATKTGGNIGERTQEDRIKEFTKILMDSGVGTSKVSRSLAEKIEQSGLGMSGFESKEEAIKKGIIEENQLYFDKQGKTYKGKKVGDEIKLIEVQFTKSK
jgi:hypothetical protein